MDDPWEGLLPDEMAEVQADRVDHATGQRVSVEFGLGRHRSFDGQVR